MTACTNHGGKARRVVTAALVGVLSVGTVPMVALAEGVSDAVSPMFATGGIDGTEQRGGHVDEAQAALECRCGKSAEVGHHASAKVYHQRAACGTA